MIKTIDCHLFLPNRTGTTDANFQHVLTQRFWNFYIEMFRLNTSWSKIRNRCQLDATQRRTFIQRSQPLHQRMDHTWSTPVVFHEENTKVDSIASWTLTHFCPTSSVQEKFSSSERGRVNRIQVWCGQTLVFFTFWIACFGRDDAFNAETTLVHWVVRRKCNHIDRRCSWFLDWR